MNEAGPAVPASPGASSAVVADVVVTSHDAASTVVTSPGTAALAGRAPASGASADLGVVSRLGLGRVLGAAALLLACASAAWFALGPADEPAEVAGGADLGGGADDDPDVLGASETGTGSTAAIPSSAPGSSAAPASTAPPPSSTTSTTVTTTTTTTVPTGPVATLTGARVPQEVAGNVGRALLAVKIDNYEAARPQAGLNQADAVVEVVVEGGLTRFIALFQSTDAEVIGPVRSARTTDVGILKGLGAPVFAYSGANPGTFADLRSTRLVLAPGGSGFRRDPYRPVPHNLMTSTAGLYRQAAGATVAPALFAFRAPDQGHPGSPVAGVRVAHGGGSEWVWSADSESWMRFQRGTPHVDSDGAMIAPANVVIAFTPYSSSPHDANSPQADLEGTGPAWYLSGGTLHEGSWRRLIPDQPPQFLGADGSFARLAPGRTWVVLAQPGQASVIGAGRTGSLLATVPAVA